MAGQYKSFKSKKISGQVSPPGGGYWTVHPGDMIAYTEHYEGGTSCSRLARVLGLATHDGTGKAYSGKKVVFAVLAVNDTITFGYERHVKEDYVTEVSPAWDDFKEWFFGHQNMDPETTFWFERYGALNKRISDYVDAEGELPDPETLRRMT